MTAYARYAYAVVAWLFVAALVVQVFLAGLFVFGQEAFRATHVEFGYTALGLAALLLLVTALVARPGRRELAWPALALVFFVVQTVLPLFRASLPAAAALHPVNALVIFGVAAAMAQRSPVLLRDKRQATDREAAEGAVA